MQIQLLVLQRKQSYPGELLPEVLAVVSEATLEENPDWWPQEIARNKEIIGEDAEAWAVVSAELSEEALAAALNPTPVQIDLDIPLAYATTKELATPPAGWFTFGTHVDRPVTLEFWGHDESGLPIWERPAPSQFWTWDYTPAPRSSPYCLERKPGTEPRWHCVGPKGHDGPHVAADGRNVLGTWVEEGSR